MTAGGRSSKLHSDSSSIPKGKIRVSPETKKPERNMKYSSRTEPHPTVPKRQAHRKQIDAFVSEKKDSEASTSCERSCLATQERRRTGPLPLRLPLLLGAAIASTAVEKLSLRVLSPLDLLLEGGGEKGGVRSLGNESTPAEADADADADGERVASSTEIPAQKFTPSLAVLYSSCPSSCDEPAAGGDPDLAPIASSLLPLELPIASSPLPPLPPAPTDSAAGVAVGAGL